MFGSLRIKHSLIVRNGLARVPVLVSEPFWLSTNKLEVFSYNGAFPKIHNKHIFTHQQLLLVM